ncbi:DUF4159 domain-containing protein [Paralimibaculum aggregatum]|uniref:DUF4159 domain-containing protein n=1 Tax=Paralimibaculum aggregatum TaxID=3036245 RepID=A0ABQ6LKL8_9RHOB|nr:DUF4159 domain-containing protein [Limibaculum sp. NKW23]GMG83790.1 DUF4159 domain-containing protein [Limibaculum sp. NKW23]
MLSLGPLAFLNPWLLAGLAVLPILWWLLRAIPPSPRRQPFAAVRLLLGLEDKDRESEKTPWWLLLLRALAVAAAVLGFAQPVLNPAERLVEDRDGPLLLLMDQGWASAPDWAARQAAAAAALDEAREAGRGVIFWPLAESAPPPVAAAEAVRPALEGLVPAPWGPDRTAALTALAGGALPAPGQTIWLHDGLDGPDTTALAAQLADAGPLRLIGPPRPALALAPPRLEDGLLAADLLRAGGPAEEIRVVAFAEDANGAERRIAVADAAFAEGETRAAAVFDLPPELIRRVSRLVLADRPSAGGAALATGAIRRVAVGLVDPGSEATVVSLTSARHYLTKALSPVADIREGSLDEVLEREPAAIVLADYGAIAETERERLTAFVEERGGLLVRFAGPRLAAAIGERIGQEDALLPVRLRRGGRVLGGALAWSSPRRLGPFDPDGVFRRLEAPGEVAVRTQVLAEPGPELQGRVWATLEDGTPLVTARKMGAGHVVLFHVSADAEWSSLPLSGLFVEMLGRLMALAPGQSAAAPEPEALGGTLWRPELLLGPDGTPRPATGAEDPVPGERMAELRAGAGLAPGLYARADRGARPAGSPTELILNLHAAEDRLAPFPAAPAGAVEETLGGAEAQPFAALFLTVAVLLALADIVATLIVSGRLSRLRRPAAAAGLALAAALGLGLGPTPAEAQQSTSAEARAVNATAETTLGYIRTGDPRIDEVSERAMVGLGMALTNRTAVEPGPPMGLDPARDELSFYPVLYWPLNAQNLPSEAALSRLAGYLTGGGLLVIDTQNGASGFSGASEVEMRRIARALNLPPLAPVDADHVLTRTFYLLDRFPGRWRGGRVWAEAPPPVRPGAPRASDLPSFDRVDDNVSPVVVGSADWASAWAVDPRGRYLFPVGRTGDRQREMAIRFGVNLVMYALTGNYKSDQVHAPEVLHRLGQ